MNASPHCIVTTDGRIATLFSCTGAPGTTWRIQPLRTLENHNGEKREHHRPYSLGGGSPGKGGQHFASRGHEDEEDERRFAGEVRTWLADAIKEFKIEHVTVFAAHRALGHLRHHEAAALAARTDLREAELTHLRAHELAQHPAVVGALNAEPR